MHERGERVADGRRAARRLGAVALFLAGVSLAGCSAHSPLWLSGRAWDSTVIHRDCPPAMAESTVTVLPPQDLETEECSDYRSVEGRSLIASAIVPTYRTDEQVARLARTIGGDAVRQVRAYTAWRAEKVMTEDSLEVFLKGLAGSHVVPEDPEHDLYVDSETRGEWWGGSGVTTVVESGKRKRHHADVTGLRSAYAGWQLAFDEPRWYWEVYRQDAQACAQTAQVSRSLPLNRIDQAAREQDTPQKKTRRFSLIWAYGGLAFVAAFVTGAALDL